MAPFLGSNAAWEAANACLQTLGGYGFAAEYDVERQFRETRLYQIAPISTSLIISYIDMYWHATFFLKKGVIHES